MMMAGDWIRMRVGLTTHPRVMRIAECLAANNDFCDWAGFHFHMGSFPPNAERSREEEHAALRVTRYITVTALLKFWSYANEHAKGDFVAGIWPEDVDEITGVPGFANAISASGWALFGESGGMTLPNFQEHNTAFLQRKSDSAERQKRYRERKKATDGALHNAVTVTRDITRDDREEKRREEKKHISGPGADAPDGFQNFWKAWPTSPRKGAKPECLRRWLARGLETDAVKIIAHVESLKTGKQWADPQFIPAPLTYLNQSRWDGAEEAADPFKGVLGVNA